MAEKADKADKEPNQLMPLYGFISGDCLVLLILAYENDTVADLITKLQKSARMRVPVQPNAKLFFQGNELEPSSKLKQIGIKPLDRFDVVQEKTP